jgi:hypothetical protein
MGTWAAPFADMRPEGNLGLYAVLAFPSEGESLTSKLLGVFLY